MYEKYAAGLAYVAVELPNGDQSIGSAFHVGGGVFVTARHVVEKNRILSVTTTVHRHVPDPNGLVSFHGLPGKYRWIEAGEAKVVSGPHCHPKSDIDVAAIVTEGLEAPVIPL